MLVTIFNFVDVDRSGELSVDEMRTGLAQVWCVIFLSLCVHVCVYLCSNGLL